MPVCKWLSEFDGSALFLKQVGQEFKLKAEFSALKCEVTEELEVSQLYN